MRNYYLYATVVNRFSDDMIGRCIEANRAYRWVGRLASRDIRPGVRIVAEELVIADPAAIDADPALLLRIFADAQRHGVPIANGTRRIIRGKASLIDDRVRRSPEAARAFLDVLTWKHGVYDTLQQMHKLDVLDAYLPEFAHLRCLSQYDRYHIYTVDEHILRGIQNLEQLRLGAYKEQLPLLTSVMREISDVEILYVGMLYHDAGKGRGGDHSNKGAAMVMDVAARLHLDADAAEQLGFLVRQHLTMHHLATRRDIHDPELVNEFTRVVGSRDNLDKLYVLTFGDLKATNPKLWNSWQNMLLAELYELGLEALERDEKQLSGAAERAARARTRIAEALGDEGGELLHRFLAEMPDRYFVGTSEARVRAHLDLYRQFQDDELVTRVEHFREREFSELTVVTADRPGLFSRIAGVLRASGMSIGGALVFSGRDGTAFDVIRLPHIDHPDVVCSEERWARVRNALRAVILEGADVEELVARSIRTSPLGDRFVPRLPTRIEIDNQVSREFTVIDVYATDRLGILFAITNALYHLGLRIHLAKIGTSVDRVLDVFYVTDDENRKVEDPAYLARIDAGLHQALLPFAEPSSADSGGAAAAAPA
jgi:[protein-PII] uridylyltransferase